MWNWKRCKGTKPNSLKTFLPANLITSYLSPTQETKAQRNAQHGNIFRWQLERFLCILELITPFTFRDLTSVWEKINNSSNFKTYFSPTTCPVLDLRRHICRDSQIANSTPICKNDQTQDASLMKRSKWLWIKSTTGTTDLGSPLILCSLIFKMRKLLLRSYSKSLALLKTCSSEITKGKQEQPPSLSVGGCGFPTCLIWPNVRL